MRLNRSSPKLARGWLVGLVILCARLAQPASAQAPLPTIESTIEALRAHEYPKALEMAQALVQAQPRDPKAWTLKGAALSGLGQVEEALRAYHRALELQPDYLAALEGAAQLEYQAGSPQAKESLERILRFDPANETAHSMLASLAFRQMQCATVVWHYERAQSAIAKNPAALMQFGVCLVNTRKLEDARPVFERLLALQPDDWHNRYNLGLIQYLTQQYPASIQTLQPLVNGTAPEEEALNLIAAAYEANHETPSAAAALRRATVIAPKDVRNYLDLATLCMDHLSFQVGVDIVTAGLKVLPDSPELYTERAVLYAQLMKYDEAEADFETANQLQPQQAFASVGLGIALLERNDTQRSLEVIRARLKGSPDEPTLNYLLAEVLARRGAAPGTPEFQEAEAAAQRAVKAKPAFAPAHDVLSRLYLRAGDGARSITESRLALRLDPTERAASQRE